jgi:peptide deformylase
MARQLKYVDGNLIEYEVFNLVDFYDPILRKPTEPFDFSSPNAIKEAEFLAHSLAASMQKYGGIGLSANQLGINKRVCAVAADSKIWILFNPVIVERSLTESNLSEGCLSYPGLYIKVPRADTIKVRFQAIGGQSTEQEVSGITSVCIQHELDHLDGIVYTDRISPIKLDQAKRKVKKNLKKISRLTVQQAEKLLANMKTA